MLPREGRAPPRVLWCASAARADLVILLEAGGNRLVAQLAEDMAHDQAARTSSTTVGGRFRDQLRDLISRLDQCAQRMPPPPV